MPPDPKSATVRGYTLGTRQERNGLLVQADGDEVLYVFSFGAINSPGDLPPGTTGTLHYRTTPSSGLWYFTPDTAGGRA